MKKLLIAVGILSLSGVCRAGDMDMNFTMVKGIDGQWYAVEDKPKKPTCETVGLVVTATERKDIEGVSGIRTGWIPTRQLLLCSDGSVQWRDTRSAPR